MKFQSFGLILCCIGCWQSSIASDCLANGQDVSGRIRTITLKQQPIFDEPATELDEFTVLYENANRFHPTTKHAVIQKDLLMQVGDVFDQQVLAATERRLRSRQYLSDVQVIAEQACELGSAKVDVTVQVKEVWTLEPELRFSTTGNVSSYTIGIQDTNVFGLGKRIGASRYSDAYREGFQVYYSDPNTGLFDTELALGFAKNDDGGRVSASLTQPFVSLDSPWTAGFSFVDIEQDDRIYDQGVEVDRYKVDRQDAHIFYGFALNRNAFERNESRVWRLLFGYSWVDKIYSVVPQTLSTDVIPRQHSYQYPWVELQRTEHRFRPFTNITVMNQVEDINFGLRLSTRLGFVDATVPFLDQQLLFAFSLGQYFQLGQRHILAAHGHFNSFIDPKALSTLVDARMSLDLHYYWNPKRWGNQGQLFIRFQEARVIDPLNNSFLEIGAHQGGRGYPSRYQAGDRQQILTLEKRYFGAKEWFSLVYIGGAIFYDAAHTWGDAAIPAAQQGWLHSAGIGLRVSSNRLSGSRGGGHTTLHFDLAAPVGERPVNATQFLVAMKKRF